MPTSQSWDAIQLEKMDLSYDKSQAELSEIPRLVSGYNTFVTLGGKLCKRLGTTLLTGTNITNHRIDRIWIYETDETPPKVYLIVSAYNLTFLTWELFYINLEDVSPAWTLFTNTRSINQSTRPHEGISSRGLFYVKSYPNASTGEKLGTVLFDGSGSVPVVKYWGILPPTIPAALAGAVTKTTADISAVDATVNVSSSTGFPIVPFNVQLEYELVTVTAVVGTAWTIARGVNGTTAAAHTSGTTVVWRDWAASAHQVDVLVTWGYSYAWKTSTGQVSSRAPLETNPDKLPSRTGPFQDLIPKFVVQGYADTTNVPSIMMFRTSDGGGTYYFLEEITNTGSGPILYQDKSFESGVSGGVFQDPVPDSLLDTSTIAPTLTLNNPPPTVIAPEIVGIDTPIASTPLASYSGRLWIGIGNVVFYSGDEEITLGIPEECWPSGTFGNFYRCQYPITNLISTISCIYIFTTQTIYQITGTNKETFNIQPVFESIGAPVGEPRAISKYQDVVVALTQDYRVILINNNKLEVISDQLSRDIVDAVNAGGVVDIKYWGSLEKEWIIVAVHNQDDSSLSRQWIYDIKKSDIVNSSFWFTPWEMKISAMQVGNDSDVSSHVERHWISAMYNSTTGNSCLVKADASGATGTDYFVTEDVPFGFEATLNTFQVPPGNHVNKLRQPVITPIVYGIALDRLLFDDDTDPVVEYFLDDLWTFPLEPTNFEPPARRQVSKGFRTMVFGIDKVAQHVAVRIGKIATTELFECMNLVICFEPDSGV